MKLFFRSGEINFLIPITIKNLLQGILQRKEKLYRSETQNYIQKGKAFSKHGQYVNVINNNFKLFFLFIYNSILFKISTLYPIIYAYMFIYESLCVFEVNNSNGTEDGREELRIFCDKVICTTCKAIQDY